MISVIQINFKDCLINKMKCCKCIYFIQDFVLTRDQYINVSSIHFDFHSYFNIYIFTNRSFNSMVLNALKWETDNTGYLLPH